MIWNAEKIKKEIEENDLITGFLDLETQLQPNGFDLTVEKIHEFHPNPKNFISFENKFIDEREPIRFGKIFLYTKLEKGVYKFKVNETIKIPPNACAISTQRSSVMRMGNLCNVGFWDAGYHGSGYSIIVVNNPVRIFKNARLIQIYFMGLSDTTKLVYGGNYQWENIICPELNKPCIGEKCGMVKDGICKINPSIYNEKISV